MTQAEQEEKVKELVLRHSYIAGGIALIPIPGVSEIAVVVNQLTMYGKINDVIGIKLSDNFLKIAGKFLISQVICVVGGFAAVLGIVAVLKFIPGLNFLAGFAAAPAAGIGNYICGLAYYYMLRDTIEASGGAENFAQLTPDEQAALLKLHKLNKEKMESIREQAKSKLKNADYKSFKKEGEAYAEAAKRNKSQYEDILKDVRAEK